MEAHALLVSAALHKAIKTYSSAHWRHAHAQTETYMYMYMCVVTVDMRYGWRCSHSHEFDLIMVTQPQVRLQAPHSIINQDIRHPMNIGTIYNEYRHPYVIGT